MLNLTLIGNRITERRKELNLTQNTLAEQLYVTHQAVSKWENGKSLPTIDILYELTKILQVSIDYLLDDSDILEQDYETKFKNYPRNVVLTTYLKQSDWHEDLENIFYLCNTDERYQIINRIIHTEECDKVRKLWPYLNDEERSYILGVIISGNCDFNINTIQHQLTTEEQLLLHKKGIRIHPISIKR